MQLVLNLNKAATGFVKPGHKYVSRKKNTRGGYDYTYTEGAQSKAPHIPSLEERVRREKEERLKAERISRKKDLSKDDVMYLMDHNRALIQKEANLLASRYGRPDMVQDVVQDMHLAFWATHLSNQNKAPQISWFTHLFNRGKDYAKRQIQKYGNTLRFTDAERDARRYKQIQAVSQQYEAKYGHEPSQEEISEMVGVPLYRVQELMLSHVTESLQDTKGGGENKEIPVSETIASGEKTPEEEYEAMSFKEVFYDRLYKLPKTYHDYIAPFIDHITEKTPLEELADTYQRPRSTIHRKMNEMRELLKRDKILQEFKARIFNTLTIAKALKINSRIFGIDIKTFKLYKYIFG